MTNASFENAARWMIVIAVAGLIAVFIFTGAHHPPQVIVNMPADAKALAQLPPPSGDAKVLSNERAILFWTVYSAAIEHHREYPVSDATQAVEAAYGSKP
jgi:hypothetical protein